MSWGLLRRQHESHIRAKGLSYKCCLAWGPIVGSVPVAVTVFREVCERTMRDATASSDVSDPASRNSIGRKLKSLSGICHMGTGRKDLLSLVLAQDRFVSPDSNKEPVA